MAARDTTTSGGPGGAVRRLTTETKSFFKTSEFWVFVILTLAILIAGNSIEGEEGGGDFFAADKVWLYITLLGLGYMFSRGIAKSGVRDPYWDRPAETGDSAPLPDRVKAAAEVLTQGETSGAGSGRSDGR